MRTIYKYAIPVVGEPVTLEFPRGYKILSFGHQGDPGTVLLWAEVESEVEELVEQTFQIFGTGHEVKDPAMRYVATVNVWQAGLVWHVYTNAEA